MNIVEAFQAAKGMGKTCIALKQMNGSFKVIQPTGTEDRCICGIFGSERPLSYAYARWSPTTADLISEGWFVPDMTAICGSQNSNPAEKEDKPVSAESPAPAPASSKKDEPMSETERELLSEPVHGEKFKKALKAAKIMDIFDALSQVADKKKNGEKVKSRFEALDAEFRRRKERGKNGK